MDQNEKKTILVVDDEPDLRDIFRDELELAGFQVLMAENGTDAWKTFQSTDVSCVISDIRMPGGGGLLLLQRIREKSPHIPVILVSGFAEVEQAGAKQQGVTRLLSKPVDLEKLVAAVRDSLRDSVT